MIIKRIFHFPIATLFTEADLILTTAESDDEKDLINARLDDGYVAAIRAIDNAIDNAIDPENTGNTVTRGDLGQMTSAQRTALNKVKKLKTRARKSARLAFRGQTVKLHETFLVGNDTPAGIGKTLENADTIQAGCAASGNVGPLKSLGGWTAADTTAFASAIVAARAAFKDHLEAEAESQDATNTLTEKANTLYLGLLTIQNAANNEHPDDDPAHRGIRKKIPTWPLPTSQRR